LTITSPPRGRGNTHPRTAPRIQFDTLVDCWFLDGFSPAKNPELWEEDLLKNVYRCTVNGGTLSTYSAAGYVRRNLSLAGFQVERISGFGRKRHMTIALKNDEK